MISNDILILASGNENIGMGHVNRCLSLFLELNKTYKITFYSLYSEYLKIFYEKNNINYILFKNKSNLLQYLIEQKNCCIITDSYDLKEDDYKIIKSCTYNLISIIDYVGTYMWCDLLISPNICMTEGDFETNKNCKKLVGKKYIFLKDSIIDSYSSYKENELTISLGGADLYGATFYILEGIKDWVGKNNYKVNVVIGPYFNQKSDLRDMCLHMDFSILENCNNLGSILSKSKYAIISGGVTLHECLYLNVIPIVFIQADNQIKEVEYISNDKKLIYCGNLKNMCRMDVIKALSIGFCEVTSLLNLDQNYIDNKSKERVLYEIKSILM